jgi:hypothetical protein
MDGRTKLSKHFGSTDGVRSYCGLHMKCSPQARVLDTWSLVGGAVLGGGGASLEKARHGGPCHWG